ncbi:hypothetical protein KM043_010646 [Ampulex compressa]|nr:hypothetical protein KM043_010646 [Ampulex compressa]
MIRTRNWYDIWSERINSPKKSEATEKATSRKCEGQLSSVKTNSCSCHKNGNRKKMAQGDSNPCWDSLPSVILEQIFSYLPQESRLRASQVCKNWRSTFFHPSFWKKITFTLTDWESISWARFLADSFGRSVHEVTIRCYLSRDLIEESSFLLTKLFHNRHLRKLFLESDSRAFGNLENEDYDWECPTFMMCLLSVVKTSTRLEAVSLGCIEELADSAHLLVHYLREYHAKHLRHLSLASVIDNTRHFSSVDMDLNIFNSFTNLAILTVDYSCVRDELLQALDNGVMERLVIHIHSWNCLPAELTSDAAWGRFVQKNPRCELRLTILNYYKAVQVLDTNILRPSMPLTHLKVLFCEDVNIRALHRISIWYPTTLKSLTWIDSMSPLRTMPATHDPSDPDGPDPLVLVAWKCTALVEIVFIGHLYYQQNLLAIARLRGSTLKLLMFAKRDLSSDGQFWHEASFITKEIKKIMGHQWEPLSDAELPAVVMKPVTGDIREVIMPLVLRDQK